MIIQGTTAIVTGASRGIGKEIAFALGKAGAKTLVLVGRDKRCLIQVANEIKALGINAVPISLDLTDVETVNNILTKTWQKYGPFQLLINCAGVAHQTDFLNSNPSNIEEEIKVNILGTITVTLAIARLMAAQRSGTEKVIVNVSSLMGKVGAPTMATYAATKSAILSLTKSLRPELLKYGIKMVSLVPSLTDTDMTKDLQLFSWVSSLTPQQVADSLIKGLQRNSSEILVGWQSHIAIFIQRISPSILERVLAISAPSITRE